MQYLLVIYMNEKNWDALSDEERQGIMNNHDAFQKQIKGSGEFVSTYALANPEQSAFVRPGDGVPAVTDGPYMESKEYMAGYYIVDCETKERAYELATMMPEAPYFAIEVRPIMYANTPEL